MTPFTKLKIELQERREILQRHRVIDTVQKDCLVATMKTLEKLVVILDNQVDINIPKEP